MFGFVTATAFATQTEKWIAVFSTQKQIGARVERITRMRNEETVNACDLWMIIRLDGDVTSQREVSNSGG
jgi:hypothetical protein